MKILYKINYGHVFLLIVKVAITSILSMLLFLPFSFLAIWALYGFSSASYYFIPTSIILSVMLGNVVSSATDDNEAGSFKDSDDGLSGIIVLFISIASLFVFFFFIADFKFRPEVEEKDELSEKEKEEVQLRIKCRDHGYSYARSAQDPSRRDITIPKECRGHPSTNEGIQLYYSR